MEVYNNEMLLCVHVKMTFLYVGQPWRIPLLSKKIFLNQQMT